MHEVVSLVLDGPFSRVADLTNMFSSPSEEGTILVRQVLWDLWPPTSCDYQLEVVTKALDGADVLAILPIGAGKTAILTTFIFVLNYNGRKYGQTFGAQCAISSQSDLSRHES
ncbi:hypothetical protein BDM02DRAFT_3128723 [Thelephora ganbajun]|uniref:Uncharacterized protein n=1 Tax=Thelephora ganbajun TaxID=370292 RepID=A0ACB6ZII5_THEGA|nr:hypothetical protein BDM02DRAFT_3128723 [Thelephora ganbajun]